MKTGIGRTRSFADTLLHHRMEVVVVPELPKGELPTEGEGREGVERGKKEVVRATAIRFLLAQPGVSKTC